MVDRPQSGAAAPASVALAAEEQRESLQHGAFPRRGVGVVAVAGADLLVEDVPVPEIAVAAEVDLAGAEAADRHADLGQFRAATDGPRAAGRERFDPRTQEALLGRHQAGKIGGRQRAGHQRQPAAEGRGRPRAQDRDEFPPAHCPAAVARSRATRFHRCFPLRLRAWPVNGPLPLRERPLAWCPRVRDSG